MFLLSQTAFSQTTNTVRISVKSHEADEYIAGANVSVKGTSISSGTDERGTAVLENIPEGTQTIIVTAEGFEDGSLSLSFPDSNGGEFTVTLEPEHLEAEVTVSSTRTGRSIEAEPSRVEAIDEEEIDEKINMRPANVSMVLNESTGIFVQQTSPTANTQSIRLQGLDGRYTQLLKDGFPAYGGFSSSLSVLEIPPLDLKQVEIIKGPAATLYGGDAIAGVVNFITKDPSEKPLTTILFNQTTALGTDVSVFNTARFGKIGYTLLGSTNFQKEYDVDDDDFTELPRTRAFGITPKVVFYIDDKTTLTVGNSFSKQTRTGGDIFVIRGEADSEHKYFERTRSTRNVTTFNFNRAFASGAVLNVKQSLAFFARETDTPAVFFKGTQFNSYTDASYLRTFGRHALVIGGTALIDSFREETRGELREPRDEDRRSVGAYIQDTFDISEKWSAQMGLRVDRTGKHGTFVLPRASLLYRVTDALTARAGFGLGYKTPTMFTEDSERLLFENVAAMPETVSAERSRGGTFDINYEGKVGEDISYSLNQMFFYTLISDPLILRPDGGGIYRFSNAPSPIISKGFETNARVGYGIAKLFVGYTFTDAKAGYLPGDRVVPLLPKSKVNASFVLERHEDFKTGVEFHFTGRQTLEDRTTTRSYAVVGLFGEKTFGNFSLFINAENITDRRQSRFGRVVFPPYDSPTFADIYMHTEGRIINGGIKLRF